MFATLNILSPGGPVQVDLGFAGPGEGAALKSWKVPARHSRPEIARDAVELAQLAGKRWRYYLRRNEAATSITDLAERVRLHPACEVGFILTARFTSGAHTGIMAVAWCRRTWCNHIVLDFLAVHPRLNDPAGGYKGMGSAMLMGVALVAERLNSPLVWGEATESSSTFYQKLLGGIPVLDHFFFDRAALAGLRSPASDR